MSAYAHVSNKTAEYVYGRVRLTLMVGEPPQSALPPSKSMRPEIYNHFMLKIPNAFPLYYRLASVWNLAVGYITAIELSQRSPAENPLLSMPVAASDRTIQ